MVIAGREPAKQKCGTGTSRRTKSAHEVSILITAVGAEGRKRVEQPRWNVSMMIMRPPQHGQGCESVCGSLASVLSALVASLQGFGTASSSRARAMLSARVPL